MLIDVLDGLRSRIEGIARKLSMPFDILTTLFHLKSKNKIRFFKEHSHKIKRIDNKPHYKLERLKYFVYHFIIRFSSN